MARIKSGDRKRTAASSASPTTTAPTAPAPTAPAAPAPATAAPASDSWIARGPVAAPRPPAPPTERVGHLVASAIMLHGVLIVTSYLAVIRPSEVQARVLEAFAPYLATFHLAAEADAADVGTAEGVSFFLARGEASERTHRLQFKSTTDRSEQGWADAGLRGASGSGRLRRHQRFLTAVASLGESEQNALVARLVFPLIESVPDAQMVRVIRLPNIMTSVAQDPEATPYTAVILREQDRVRLVRVPPPRLSSAASVMPEQP